MIVRTPCIGLCSTTYGDLVCRGCKRWSHEIVGWIGYDDATKRTVLARLHAQREACVLQFVAIDAPEQLRAAAQRLGFGAGDALTEALLALLRRDARLEAIGCRALLDPALDGRALYAAIDGELLLRAQAAYERSQRVLVR